MKRNASPLWFFSDDEGKPANAETPVNGLNLSLNEDLEHDSSTGWSDSLTPDLFPSCGHALFH